MNTRRMKTTLLALLMLFAFNACNNTGFSSAEELVAEAMRNVNPIKVETLKTMIDEGEMILLLDVREPAEHNAGYIPGSLNIPRGVLEFKIGNEDYWEEEMLYMPEKDEQLIVYCKKGKRSILAAQTLKALGYTKVLYLQEGWKKWEMTYPLIYEKNLDQMHHEEEGEVGGC